MNINRSIIIAVCGLVASCSTAKQTTYWTEKSGIAVVHRVVGTVDTTEKLSEKRLTTDETEAAGQWGNISR
jgi:hypothetical protein